MSTGQKVAGYDVERALYLLGPTNWGPFRPKSCREKLLFVIKTIGIAILRVLNYIFGDHRWYSNKVARKIVESYCNNPQDELTTIRVGKLYEALHLRKKKGVNASFADGIRFEETMTTHHGEPQNIRVNGNRIRFFNQKMGNLTLKTRGEQYIQTINNIKADLIRRGLMEEGNFENPISFDVLRNCGVQEDELIPLMYDDSSMVDFTLNPFTLGKILQKEHCFLQNHFLTIPDDLQIMSAEDNERIERECEELKKQIQAKQSKLADPKEKGDETLPEQIEALEMRRRALIEEKNIPIATKYENEKMKILAPRLYREDVNLDKKERRNPPQPRLQNIKDPHVLFRTALELATKKLNSDCSFASLPQEVKLQFYRRAIFILLEQSSFSNVCRGTVHFNEYLELSYSRPHSIPSYVNGQIEDIPHFEADFLSESHAGCDVEGAFQLLMRLNQREFSRFKHSVGQDSKDNPSSDVEILHCLIDQMAKQMHKRYGEKIEKEMGLSDKELSSPMPSFEEPFETWRDRAQTPYQLIQNAFIYTTHKYVRNNLITNEDISCGSEIGQKTYIVLSGLLPREAILTLIFYAMSAEDFQLNFSAVISAQCGEFFCYIPSSNDPGKLVTALRYQQTPFNADMTTNRQDNVINRHPKDTGDLIKAYHLVRLLEKKNKFNLFKNYFLRDQLIKLYELKGLTEEAKKIKQVETQVLREPKGVQAAVQTLCKELNFLANYLCDNYFSGKIESELSNYVEFPSEDQSIKPVAIKIQPPPRIRITKEIQWQYMPEEFREAARARIAADVKSLDKYEIPPPKIKARFGVDRPKEVVNGFVNISKDIKTRIFAIQQQYNLIVPNVTSGSCMYGSIALKLFGGKNVEQWAKMLRHTAANYIEAHPKDFLQCAIPDSNHKPDKKGFSNEDLEKEVKLTVEKIKSNLWATHLEIAALSHVLALPINTIEINGSMIIGTNDNEEGLILANNYIGTEYTGNPILLFNIEGAHFALLTPIV